MAKRLFLGLALLVTLVSLGCVRANVQSDFRYTKRLVHDAKTGQYIGVLTGECKAYERKLDKEIVTYRVERSDGTTVDLPSDKVTVTEQ
jgi:hypothetical protein